MTGAPPWTSRERAILREEWAKGTKARDIAKMLGRSRNSVIGQTYRMALKQRAVDKMKPVQDALTAWPKSVKPIEESSIRPLTLKELMRGKA